MGRFPVLPQVCNSPSSVLVWEVIIPMLPWYMYISFYVFYVSAGTAPPCFSAAPEASSSVPSSQWSSHTRSPLASSFWHGGYSSFATKEMMEPLRAGPSLVRRTVGFPAESERQRWAAPIPTEIGETDSTHLCGAWALAASGSWEGRGNRPTEWCRCPNRVLAGSGRGSSSLLRACGETCPRMLEREEEAKFLTTFGLCEGGWGMEGTFGLFVCWAHSECPISLGMSLVGWVDHSRSRVCRQSWISPFYEKSLISDRFDGFHWE